MRHPDVHGAIFCASPVAETLEPWFLANATRSADALPCIDADVVLAERIGDQCEFPLMVATMP